MGQEEKGEEGGALEETQNHIEDVGVRVAATSPASRSTRKDSKVPEIVVHIERVAAGCKGPMKRKVVRKQPRQVREEQGEGRKVRRRPHLKKRCVNGEFTEDREDWTRELTTHCTHIHDAAEENCGMHNGE